MQFFSAEMGAGVEKKFYNLPPRPCLLEVASREVSCEFIPEPSEPFHTLLIPLYVKASQSLAVLSCGLPTLITRGCHSKFFAVRKRRARRCVQVRVYLLL